MKLLILGASGLIGQSVFTRLAADGHEVWGATRGAPRPGRAAAEWLCMDFTHPDPAGWRAQLQGFEAVVNCAGILQDSPC